MNTLYLCLGGNQGDVLVTFSRTIEQIDLLVGNVVKESAVYKTASWGDINQPDYHNQVIKIQTLLSAQKVLEQCLSIEANFGRYRDKSNQWTSRSIDVDILLYNEEQVNEQNLTIPHPRMLERNFVMIPLAEIAGELIHPVERKKISTLKELTKDGLKVECITTTLQ